MQQHNNNNYNNNNCNNNNNDNENCKHENQYAYDEVREYHDPWEDYYKQLDMQHNQIYGVVNWQSNDDNDDNDNHSDYEHDHKNEPISSPPPSLPPTPPSSAAAREIDDDEDDEDDEEDDGEEIDDEEEFIMEIPAHVDNTHIVEILTVKQNNTHDNSINNNHNTTIKDVISNEHIQKTPIDETTAISEEYSKSNSNNFAPIALHETIHMLTDSHISTDIVQNVNEEVKVLLSL